MSDADAAKARVQSQFGAVAQRYVTSASHARGDDLALMVDLARPQAGERVLDVATGGGHTALAFARHARSVVASDLTGPMLAAAAGHVRSQGVANILFAGADAEALPFADASFEIVTARIAPHHFPQPERFVQEVARVLVGGGRFILDDNMAPEEPELDAFMNRFESWRDPSHVRAYTISEWTRWVEGAGMQVEHCEPLASKRYPFGDWVARMNMPEAERDAMEAWLLDAPAAAKACFGIEVEGGRVQALCGKWSILVARRVA
jgi:ubiquinone/menaquinone biosynthesis C-methylase UbiE